jgi:hypothetical protein
MQPDLRITADRIVGVDDAELAWRVIELAYDAVSIHDGPEVLEEHLRPLTDGQRALLAVHWCVSETLNGGFDQFFTNPSGLLADEARFGFELVGLPQAAKLLDEARAILADRPPAPDPDDPDFDEAEDDERFDAYRGRHEPLEAQFYALVSDSLDQRLAAYVRARPEQFTR